MKNGLFKDILPAKIVSYDASKRLCQISIPHLTDGGDTGLTAEILYPVGDKSKSGDNSTELEIVAGDDVWITFIGGDARYPLIVGYRNPQAGNSVGWRKYHHANEEHNVDSVFNIKSGTKIKSTVGGSSVEVTPQTTNVIGSSSVVLNGGGSSFSIGAGGMTMDSAGNITLNVSSFKVICGSASIEIKDGKINLNASTIEVNGMLMANYGHNIVAG